MYMVYYSAVAVLCLGSIVFIASLNYKQNKETVKELTKIIVSLRDKSSNYAEIQSMEKILNQKPVKLKKPKNVKVNVEKNVVKKENIML